MKFAVLVVIPVFLAILTSTASQRPRPRAKTTSCVLFRGVSRCVENRIPKSKLSNRLRRSGVNLCPFHICGPSYRKADDCPTNGDPQATAKCQVRSLQPRLWLCQEHAGRISTVALPFPFGCRPDECKAEVITCDCKRRQVNQTKYTHIVDATPQC